MSVLFFITSLSVPSNSLRHWQIAFCNGRSVTKNQPHADLVAVVLVWLGVAKLDVRVVVGVAVVDAHSQVLVDLLGDTGGDVDFGVVTFVHSAGIADRRIQAVAMTVEIKIHANTYI